MKKVSLVFMSLFLFVFVLPQIVLAADAKIILKNVNGMVLRADEELGRIHDESENSVHNVIKDLIISYDNNNVMLDGTLNYNGKLHDILAIGSLYPVKGNGVYKDKLILGDFTNNNNLNIAHFKLEKKSKISTLLKTNSELEGKTSLTMVLENVATGEIVYAQSAINAKDFDFLMQVSNEQLRSKKEKEGLTDRQLDEATIKLLPIENNFKNENRKKPKLPKENQVTGSGTSQNPENEESFITTDTSVNFYELDRLFNDLKSNGTVNLSNYSIPTTIFSDGGWDKYNSSMFTYHKFSDEDSFSTFTQISMIDNFNGFYDPNRYFIELKIKHGMTVEYDKYTGDLSVFYYNFGLELHNMEYSITKLENQNVWIKRKVYGELYQQPNYITAALALVPLTSTAYSAWDYLTAHMDQGLTQEENFDPTYDLQLQRYTDKVIRGIYADFSGYYALDEGNRAALDGQFYRDPSGYISLWWYFKYTAYHSF